MPQTYTVRVVGEQEWKDLVSANPRYAHVDEDNVGFSDPPNRKAYVRESFLKEFPGSRRYLIQHEFEHLVSDEPWHEDEFGVRHKKVFKNVLQPIFRAASIAAAPFTGGLSLLYSPISDTAIAAQEGQRALGKTALKSYGVNVLGAGGGSALGGALTHGSQGGSSLGGALGAGGATLATGGTPQAALANAVIGGGGGFAQQPLSSFLNPRTAGGTMGPALGAAGPALGGSLVNPRTGGISQATGTASLSPASVGTNVPAAVGTSATPSGSTLGGGVSGSVLSPLQKLSVPLGGLGSVFGGGSQQYLPGLAGTGTNPQPPQPPGGGGGGGGGGQQTPPQQQSVLNRLFGLSANVAGPIALGAGLAGIGQAAGNARMPSVPELTQTPAVQNLAQTSEARLQPIATQLGGLQNAELPAGIRADITRQFDLERRNVASQFKQFRPNADVATDTDFARAMADLDQRQAGTLAQAQLSFQGVQRQNLLAQAGVTSEELNTLRDLAQLDVQTIMIRTGLRAEQANQIKELFGGLGGTLAGVGVLNAFRTP